VYPIRLVTVSESSHTTHDTEHIVVHRIHAYLRRQRRTDGVVGQREDERRIVDTGEVARTAGLVLLGLEREGVHVDTHGGDVGVVLVRLHQVEVATLALIEPVVAVELDLGRHDRVAAGHALDAGHGVARLQDRAVEPVGVVEGLETLVGVHRAVAGHEAVALDNPHQLLRGVVEVQLDLVGGAGHGLTARELQLLDQVLVRDLGEAAALIRVEVDVIDVQRRADQAGRGHAGDDGAVGARAVPAEVGQLVELQPDLDLVVLQRDERQGQARVAVEPELQRHVQRVLRGAVGRDRGGQGLRVGGARAVAALATLDEQIHQLGHVANHVGVTGLLARLLGQLIPDLEPVTVVLVDLLATDLNVHIVDQIVADPVEPAELRARRVRGRELDLGQSGLQVHTVDQVAVAADRALDLLAEVRRAVERLLNGLHGEVRVATVDHLEESDLRVARQVDILRTISDELHKATGSHVLYPAPRKKFRQLREHFSRAKNNLTRSISISTHFY